YMSPEQARGMPLDARADLFSFGLVLYEMATSVAPTAGMRLHALPRGLKRIISKCLQNDPGLRYQHASDIRDDLRRLKPDAGSRIVFTSYRKLIAPAAAAMAVLAAAYFYFHRAPIVR